MKKLIPLFLILIINAGLADFGADIDPFEILEASAFKADFETGSVGPWSSYPPAQDTAYDPTIWVKGVDGNPGLCLVREINAWTPSQYIFGVRRKLNIYLAKESRISFRFYVKSNTGVEKIIVKLGYGDGSAGEISLPVSKLMVWQEVVIPMEKEIDSRGTKNLKAVAIMAVCRRADPEAKLRLAVDDLEITGFREKKIRVLKPGVHFLEEMGLAVAGNHFSQDQKIDVEAEFPVAMKSGEVEFGKSWEKDVLVRLKMGRVQGNIWAVTTPELGPGVWQARISGTSSRGNSLASTFVFLVKPESVPTAHPFLLFTKTELAGIKEAIERGRTKGVWDKVRQDAEAFREKFNPADFRYNLDAYDEIFWLPTYEGYVRALHTPSQFIRQNAIVFAVSGDRAAGDAARRALLSVAAWPSFVHPHILNQGQFTYWPVGLALIDFAMGYDMVYDLLSSEERKTIASALYHKGVTEVFKEYVRDNRVSSNTSNWISHVTGGGILCALAISREFKDSELEPYLTGMIVKLGNFIRSTFDPDGYYGEGYYYHNFAMQSLSHSLPALGHHFGLSFPAEVANSFQYILYQQDDETGRIYEFGDAHDDLIPSSMSNFAPVLDARNDPLLLWLYRQRPGNNYLDLLFPAPAGEGTSPQILPLVKRLRDVGSVIFRSGFGHDDFVFVLKCGPFYNHQHFDQGSFFLADRGELFIDECGNSNYYEDPWYPRLYIQAGGHNCPLTDGSVESQTAGDFGHDVAAWQDYARITSFLNWKDGAFLSADLTPVYRGKWKSLQRNVLYLRPRTVLILDRAEGAAAVDELTLRFHAPRKDDIRVDGKTAQIVRAGKTLYLRTLLPERYQASVLKRPMSLNEFKAENSITMTARGFLELAADARDGGATFVNVLSTDSGMMAGLKALEGPGRLEVSLGGSRFWIGDIGGGLYKAEDLESDALVLRRSASGILVLRATILNEKGKPILQAGAPLSCFMSRESQKIVFEFSGSPQSEIQVFTGWRPKTVRLAQKAVQNWQFKDGRILLRLPAAEGQITIER
jgi:hypothetical protein